jgi:hypothetical protein
VGKAKRNPDLREIARRLDGERIAWAVFAGAAASVYGARRALTDVDILVPASEAERLSGLFPEAEVDDHASGHRGFLLPGLDILAGLPLMDLDRAMAARLRSGEIGGVEVPVIPPEDNILLKAMWGRGAAEGKHDWEDVEAMLGHLPSLDWVYLCWRAGQFADRDRVEQVLQRLEQLWRRKQASHKGK